MKEKIYILIPVYNSEKYLKKCLDSCLNQTYKHVGVICVDDGSSDGSVNILMDYKTKYSNFDFYQKENGGASSARNYALSKTPDNGYAMFVDSDDYIDNDYLEKFAKKISNNVDLILESPISLEGNNFGKNNLFDLLAKYASFRGPYRKIMKTKLCKNILFDEEIYVGEDLVFDANLFCLSEGFCFVEPGGYHWVNNPNSLTKSKTINYKKKYMRVFDTCYTWYIVFSLLVDVCFFGDTSLKKEYLNCLAREYLEYYGYSSKYRKKYKYRSFVKMSKINKKYHIIKNFVPHTKVEKAKRLLYIYFRPFYRLVRLIYKRYDKESS